MQYLFEETGKHLKLHNILPDVKLTPQRNKHTIVFCYHEVSLYNDPYNIYICISCIVQRYHFALFIFFAFTIDRVHNA